MAWSVPLWQTARQVTAGDHRLTEPRVWLWQEGGGYVTGDLDPRGQLSGDQVMEK